MADADPPADAFDRLRLIRTTGVGPVTYRQLLRRFGSARAALDALPDLAKRGGGRAATPADAKMVAREVEAVARLGARHLFLDDPAYPALLAELDDAPAVLTVRGTLPPPTRPSVAIVGARNASAAACRFARGLAHDLAAEGATVISGLARGIDTAAHMGAGAATVAVIAGGIDVAYPPENADLQERIAQDALLIAEMPPGTEPRARHFPYRNRIIAGLAQGTVVVEAAPKSGSLITARLANEAGREVMAVPGSPLDPRAQGCNLLIREGATLIQSAADVMEQVRPIDPRAVHAPVVRYEPQPPADADDAARRVVTALLGPVPVAVDEVIRQSAIAPAVVQMVLLELELAGRLERHAGGRVSLFG
ncbi:MULTISPECIES: DNA-processing protein DprA [unclassified Sphingomonas]|uniref:DNA-processing protein DprA n=1 Tax=unclassified Sphingomonas TaxID=196159 RepID=UPI001D12C3E1|nr:DNA-processing protein DprA [Sphingomonas sp. IC4-52]MCC2981593.1 DNA-processing protein DprA [Sphingomonas sp. IC4-52]MCD2316679.1 DNA-processing protein DprA [Sphingomonas sp. IC-11]